MHQFRHYHRSVSLKVSKHSAANLSDLPLFLSGGENKMLSTTEQYQEEWGKNYRKEHTLDF
jgi:hypothetical protein